MQNCNDNLLEVDNLRTYFPVKQGLLRRTVGCVKAVDAVSFTIQTGQTFGLVGESGCGKTTVAKGVIRLTPITSGRVVFDRKDVLSANSNQLRQIRRHIGFVFQDPHSSLNPRMTVADIVGEPLKVHRGAAGKILSGCSNDRERVATILQQVGLSREHTSRYPHEFSTGQRQRIAIARALVLNPKLVICDEPVSALDVSIQSQILNLLKDLQEESHITYLFITHDLAIMEFFCDIVAVMHTGRIVEQAQAREILQNPLHPYTQLLIQSLPQLKPIPHIHKSTPTGEAPSALSIPAGCHFHPRCPLARDDCQRHTPPLEEKSNEHFAACWAGM